MDCDLWIDERIKCGICNDYFKDPTTLPCGHNFCKECISNKWDTEMYEDVYSCPKCTKTFATRPELTTNETLSVIGNKLRRLSLQDFVQDGMTAELKEKVQETFPHLRDKTKVKEKLQEMLCADHEKLLNIYCRDDQTSICEECILSTHRGHDTMLVEQERKERQQKVEEFLQKSRVEIHERELSLHKILSTFEYIKGSSKCAVESNERVFTEMIVSLGKMKEGLNRTIQEQEKALVSQAQLVEKQQRLAILSLQAIITDLETRLQVKEDILFITKSQSLIRQQETGPASIHINENISFEYSIMATHKLKEILEDCCKDAIEKIQKTVRRSLTEASRSRPQIEVRQPFKPKTRQDFLNYACPLILDLDTAHPSLMISDDGTRVSVGKRLSKKKSSKRFDRWEQVLCKEPLRGGRFYWEVEWSGRGVFVGLALEDIGRKGEGMDCGLGRNNNSWCLQCSFNSHTIWHNDVATTPTVNTSSPRIGIYLDYNAGSLEFFAVSDKMTHIHTFTSEKFSRPLYPAFGFGLDLKLQSWIKLNKLENI